MLRKNTLTKYAKKNTTNKCLLTRYVEKKYTYKICTQKTQQINVYLQDMLRKTGLLGRRNSVLLFQT